jgi:hypothetical protein
MELVEISSNPRHLGKMKRGHKVRMSGGALKVAVSPDIAKKVKKAFAKGRAFTHALSPEEIAHNHGEGLFDSIGRAFKKAGNAINDAVIKPAGRAIKPAGRAIKGAAEKVKGVAEKAYNITRPALTTIADKVIDTGVQLAPQIGAAAAAALATATGNPELAPIAAQVGSMAGKELGGLAGREAKKVVRPSRGRKAAATPVSVPLQSAPVPTRHPVIPQLNAYTGEKSGFLDKANMGTFLANASVGDLEAALARARQRSGVPQLDYSGSRSLSQYTDAVPEAQYQQGKGLYGAGIRRRNPRGRKEMSSVGIHGNLLSAGGLPAALQSQALGANFQWAHTLPPAFQKLQNR